MAGELPIIVGLLLLAVLGLYLYYGRSTTRMREEAGVEEGEIKYTDLDKPARALFSQKYQLAGKPDYIIKRGEELIPVEVKSSHPNNPFKNHILQLGAYCLLVEETHRVKVEQGVLSYQNGQHIIPFTDDLRSEVLAVMEKIRKDVKSISFKRNHDSKPKCLACYFNPVCRFKIK